MKLSKLLISIFCLSILSVPMLYAEAKENKLPDLPIKQKYTYFEAGLSYICCPTLGFGKRIQKAQNGADFKLQISCMLPYCTFINGMASAKWLFFPKPNLKKQAYIGLGGHTGYTLCEGLYGPFIGPNFTLGVSSLKRPKQPLLNLPFTPKFI